MKARLALWPHSLLAGPSGLIGQIKAVPGKRAGLAALLLPGAPIRLDRPD